MFFSIQKSNVHVFWVQQSSTCRLNVNGFSKFNIFGSENHIFGWKMCSDPTLGWLDLFGAKILRLRPILSETFRFVRRRWGGRRLEVSGKRGLILGAAVNGRFPTGQVVAGLMVRYGSWELCMLCEIRPCVHLNSFKQNTNDFTTISWLLAMICTTWFCPICKRHMSACFLNNGCLALRRLGSGRFGLLNSPVTGKTSEN